LALESIRLYTTNDSQIPASHPTRDLLGFTRELLGFPRELLGFTRNYRDFVPSFLCLDQLALELDGSSAVFVDSQVSSSAQHCTWTPSKTTRKP
jgi:hypothetical protein